MGGGGGGGLTNGACVAQQYVPRPLLIDGFKFDLRLYVLVTACSPLRVYMFHNGLVRLCTKAYEAPDASNLGDHCMHLTNYAINKHSENFVPNEFAEEQDAGSKRSLAWFMEWFAERHGDGRAALLWQRMGFLCTKMLLPILPTLQREYGEVFEKKKKQKNVAKENEKGSHHHHHPTTMTDDEAADGSHCFEILGVDVMVDEALKPWLIEVNTLPSFATDSPLDDAVKAAVLEQTLQTVRARPSDRPPGGHF